MTFQNLRLVADQVDGNRIDKVHIYLTEEPKEQPEDKTAKNSKNLAQSRAGKASSY